MELSELKLRTVMYYMQSFVISAGGKTFEVPRTMILDIDIYKNYDAMIYALWLVKINIPTSFYMEMVKNPDNISVSMNLQYRLADTNDQINSPNGAFTTEVAGNFKAIMPDNSPVADATLQVALEKEESEQSPGYAHNVYTIVDLSLYNTAARAASFNKINQVFTSINMTDAFTYCLNQSGISNVLLSRADNNKSYSEFKILPQSGVENMLRIVQDYKFHNDGSVLFFDLVDSYLVTKKIGCYAWKNNEYKSTHFLSLSQYSEAVGNYDGFYANSKEKYYVIAVPRQAFVISKLDNAPVLQEDKNLTFLTIQTTQAILTALTPNKEYVVNIDSPDATKYNGKYRIRSVGLKLTPSGELLNPAFTIVLRK